MPHSPLTIAIDVVILVLAFLVGILLARARTLEFDYTLQAETLRRRREEALKSSFFRRLLSPVSESLGRGIAAVGFTGHLARVRQMLAHSGNPEGFTAEEFAGYGLGLGLMTASVLMIGGLVTSGSIPIILPLLLIVGIYWMRLSQLQSAADRRRVLTNRQLPYVLDLIALSMGAGATFLNSCRTLAARQAKGPVEEEIGILLSEVESGVVMKDALVNATLRTKSEDWTSTLLAVKQGEELGTPLVDIFKRQAELNRFIRSQRGEQAAARLPNRLAVPTTFLMVAVMLLFFGPIIVRAIRGELGG